MQNIKEMKNIKPYVISIFDLYLLTQEDFIIESGEYERVQSTRSRDSDHPKIYAMQKLKKI